MPTLTDKKNSKNTVTIFHDADHKVWKVRKAEWLSVTGELAMDSMSFGTEADVHAEIKRRGFEVE